MPLPLQLLALVCSAEFKGFTFPGPVPPSVSPQREDKPFGSTDEEWPLIAEMQERLRVDGVRSRPLDATDRLITPNDAWILPATPGG